MLFAVQKSSKPFPITIVFPGQLTIQEHRRTEKSSSHLPVTTEQSNEHYSLPGQLSPIFFPVPSTRTTTVL